MKSVSFTEKSRVAEKGLACNKKHCMLSLTAAVLEFVSKIKVKILRKRHNHEAKLSRGTKRRKDEEQTMTTQTPHMKPPTHK